MEEEKVSLKKQLAEWWGTGWGVHGGGRKVGREFERDGRTARDAASVAVGQGGSGGLEVYEMKSSVVLAAAVSRDGIVDHKPNDT